MPSRGGEHSACEFTGFLWVTFAKVQNHQGVWMVRCILLPSPLTFIEECVVRISQYKQAGVKGTRTSTEGLECTGSRNSGYSHDYVHAQEEPSIVGTIRRS